MNCVLQKKRRTHAHFICLQSCNRSRPWQHPGPETHCAPPLLSPAEQLHRTCLPAPKPDCLLLRGNRKGTLIPDSPPGPPRLPNTPDRPTSHPRPHLARLLKGQSLCEQVQLVRSTENCVPPKEKRSTCIRIDLQAHWDATYNESYLAIVHICTTGLTVTRKPKGHTSFCRDSSLGIASLTEVCKFFL